MPFNGSGEHSLPPGTIVADGMTVQPSQHNPPFLDVSASLSQTLLRSGVAPMTGDLNMNGNKVTGLSPAENPTDAVSLQDIESLGVAIGDGKWSVRDLSPDWLRRDGSLYDIEDYPDLAALLPALPDGVEWKSLSGLTGEVREIIADDGIFLAATGVGSDTNIYRSEDGRDWPLVATITSFSATGLVAGGGIYLAVDGNGKGSVSNDGISWSAPAYVIGSGSDGVTSAAYAFSLFIAVGTGGKISTSPDGTTWTPRTSGVATILQRVRLVNSIVVAVGNTGTVISSSDGVDWDAHTTGVTDTLHDVTYGYSLYVAVGAGGRIITSASLTGWTSRTSGTTQQLNGITYSASGMITVGAGGIARLSSNATSWTAIPTGVSGALQTIISDPEQASRYLVGGASGALLEAIRTLTTQFRVPNDGANEWIRAL